MNDSDMNNVYTEAVEVIKTAILQSQYRASKNVNAELIALYFGIGKFISDNTRDGYWGTGALAVISERLKRSMPGLRGYSEGNMKKMRIFYEKWSAVIDKSCVSTHDLELIAENQGDGILSELSLSGVGVIRALQRTNLSGFSIEDFLNVPFTHHYYILTKSDDLAEILFYIKLCSQMHYSGDELKRSIQENDYHHQSTMPNNFLQKLSPSDLAKRAVLSFKDEYFLDFINVEELGARDIADVDERVIEKEIIQNIKQFIMTFGRDFAFVGNQYHLEAFGVDHFPDLVFFNRELNALVILELKKGPFKSVYLGQLCTYLRLADDQMRKPHENPTIGIVLCSSANKKYVEYVIQDYDKPMGVATYSSSKDMPEQLRKALPDIDELKKLL
ncbi:MAG: YhcG family protein [Candidatus Cryptobacteroides sp.]